MLRILPLCAHTSGNGHTCVEGRERMNSLGFTLHVCVRKCECRCAGMLHMLQQHNHTATQSKPRTKLLHGRLFNPHICLVLAPKCCCKPCVQASCDSIHARPLHAWTLTSNLHTQASGVHVLPIPTETR